MTLSSDVPSTTSAIDVRIYDRPSDDGLTLEVRMEHARVWCDDRELRIVDERLAADARETDTLAKAAAACRAERMPLVVWDLATAVGGHVDVLRLLEQLGASPLIHAQADRRLGLSGRQMLALPTPWPIRRWAPRAARSRGAS